MKRVVAAALGIALAMPGGASAQSVLPGGASQNALTIAYGKTIDVPVAGATSAYPVNPSIAQAELVGGNVEIRGIGAGATSIIVITRDGSQTLDVTVTAPQFAVALGASGAGGGGGDDANTIEGGSYQGSYNTGAGQVTNAFEFHDQQGQSYRRLSLITASYVSPTSGSGTGIPYISYEVGGPGHDVVYLDQAISMSPLTFENSLVRGIHIADGPWIFHAGVSSVAAFGTYFIPTDSQYVAGLSRIFTISRTTDVQANFYDFVNSSNAQTSVEGGLLGSLLLSYHPIPRLLVQAEAGLSRGLGFDASAVYDDATQHADASFLDKPQLFASLASNSQQGLFANLNYAKIFNAAFNFNGGVQKSDYDLPTFREDSLTAQGNANYRLSKVLTLNGGMLYSGFESISPTAFSVRTLGIPFGIQYTGGHFTAGVSDQPTTDFQGTLADGYGLNAGVNYGPIAVAAFFNHNVDIPTVSSILSQAPGLEAALQQAGIDVSNPAQLAAVLNNAALLASLGFSGLNFNIAPTRNDVGVNATWTGVQHRQQVALNYLSSNANLTQGAFDFRLATVNYFRRIGSGNELEASVSLLKTVETTPQSVSRTNTPTYGVTVRHRFSTVPEFLFPTRRGAIEGYVFRDDDSSGHYSDKDAGLGGVQVTLDSDHTTTTDASGHYTFAGVPYGDHVVAAQVKSDKPFYYTTDSSASAQIGSTVNFGVNYVSGKIFGYVTNDAGEGIADVTVTVQGLNKSATSEADGRFVFEGVPQGRYVVTASPDSFPTGYDLSDFTPVTVNVTSNAPWPVAISAHALRSVSGTVMLFDAKRQRLVPATGVDVSIPRLGLTVKTDENGAYAFRELPAGALTIQVDGGSADERRQITLPSDPTTLTGVDFRITPGQLAPLRHHAKKG